MMVPLATNPILRRHRRSHRASGTAATTTPPSTSNDTSSTAAPSAALPLAEPCFNYFEIFPEEVGATGNVEVHDAEEARCWQLVGRVVSEAEAVKEGGCVKVTLDGAAASVYYKITDSDDEVYGRASYLSASAVASSTTSHALKEEPSVFTEPCWDACTTEEENESCSACTSPCRSTTSMRCVYPVSCAAN